MTVMITGGAGYIGSHMVKQLLEAGRNVVVVDNLSRGNRSALPEDILFYEVDISEVDHMTKIMQSHQVSQVIHFAALAYVGESVEKPLPYYANNTVGTVHLLQAMQMANVQQFVFSSTCATYGTPENLPIVETSPQSPINPYGWSKLFIEQILRDLIAVNDEFAAIGLRYFNVAGCSADGSLGEEHSPETHIIPLLLQVALGERQQFTIFGDDYPTEDGTCVRDFIHVEDICSAHLLALNQLKQGEIHFYNLGIGRGYSLQEVISSVKRVTGCDIPTQTSSRRPGDPPVLYASAQLAQRELGWAPRYTELDEIIETAWKWFSRNV